MFKLVSPDQSELEKAPKNLEIGMLVQESGRSVLHRNEYHKKIFPPGLESKYFRSMGGNEHQLLSRIHIQTEL